MTEDMIYGLLPQLFLDPLQRSAQIGLARGQVVAIGAQHVDLILTQHPHRHTAGGWTEEKSGIGLDSHRKCF